MQFYENKSNDFFQMSSSTKVLDLPSEVVKGDQRTVHCTGGAEDSEDSCDFNE